MAAHDFVHDQRLRRGALLVADVIEEAGADFGGRPGAERLADRHDVVVDGLRQADDREVVAVRAEIGGKVGRRRVGVVAADSVEDGDAVLGEPLGGHAQRVLAFLDEAALHAVGGVRQLHAAVADGRAAVAMEEGRLFAHVLRDLDTVGKQEALVAGAIGDQLDLRRDVAVAFDEASDSGRQTGREPAGGQHCDFLLGHVSSSASARLDGWALSSLESPGGERRGELIRTP